VSLEGLSVTYSQQTPRHKARACLLLRKLTDPHQDMNNLHGALSDLVKINRRVLSYDRSIISVLPQILFEDRGISPFSRLGDHKELAPLRQYKTIFESSTRIQDLPKILIDNGVDEFMFDAVNDTPDARFEDWSSEKMPDKAAAGGAAEEILRIQSRLGKGRFSSDCRGYQERLNILTTNYLDYVSTRSYRTFASRLALKIFPTLGSAKLWEKLILTLLAAGKLNRFYPSLSVGPRWSTEIEYFRERFDLPMHIGLDLVNDSTGLIIKGDMHQTPFDDAQFQLVFIKNTVDKSYDIRKLVKELSRIVKPGGYIFIDQICGQQSCTPLTRTNIQKSSNLLRLFNAWVGTRKVLVSRDLSLRSLPPEERGDATNHALLGIQL